MNYTKILLIGLFLWVGVYCSRAQNNITVTDNASHNADASAMLDVYSITKGMLVPRMTTTQMVTISNPATGLLIFNTSINSFWFFNGSIWVDLSGDTESLWGVNATTGDVYLTDLQTNIGIGTDTPLSKLALVANTGADPDEPLFEILDEFGKPIFSVTSEGVRIYVKDADSKGVSGGFAVGRYGAAKGIPDTTFLMVTPDSTRIYIQEDGKGVSGGFAVGRYGAAKGETNTIFYTGTDSTRIYTTGLLDKGVSGGFAVGRYGAAKGEGDRYMHITEDNCFIGIDAGLNNVANPPMEGVHNVFIGNKAGMNNIDGSANVYLGNWAGRYNVGNFNVFLGNGAGANSNTTGSVLIGYNAGYDETGDDKLYIETSNAGQDGALIYGDFFSDILQLNAATGIGGAPELPYMLTVHGNAIAFGFWDISDKKWKKNISKIESGLDIVNKLNPVSYNWKLEEYPEMNFTKEKQIGFIAQELELIIPELVKTDTEGNKAISYSKLTPILVKAIQEQQKQIEELNKKIDELLKLIEDK
ncbi:MAG: tail fiber domain-containing protein [Bacteroidales bacterium]|nr:tail fiber domain-containing protein [Bacteroidales bacterium]